MSKVKLILISLLAVFIISAATSASASAVTQHFDICEELSGSPSNGYSTLEKCTKNESPTGGKWTKYKLPPGTILKVDSKGTTKFTFKTTLLTQTLKIECTTKKDQGTIENPSGGGAGKDTDTIEFTGCTVPEPTGQNCTVREPIQAEATTELTEFSTKAADEFKPKATNFTEITLEKCRNTELSKIFPVKGTDTGIAVNASSELEFTNESSNLTLGAEPAKLKGNSQVLIEGSKAHLVVLP